MGETLRHRWARPRGLRSWQAATIGDLTLQPRLALL
jgi:hypothetical protein